MAITGARIAYPARKGLVFIVCADPELCEGAPVMIVIIPDQGTAVLLQEGKVIGGLTKVAAETVRRLRLFAHGRLVPMRSDGTAGAVSVVELRFAEGGEDAQRP